jgi:hypothetical protein
MFWTREQVIDDETDFAKKEILKKMKSEREKLM